MASRYPSAVQLKARRIRSLSSTNPEEVAGEFVVVGIVTVVVVVEVDGDCCWIAVEVEVAAEDGCCAKLDEGELVVVAIVADVDDDDDDDEDDEVESAAPFVVVADDVEAVVVDVVFELVFAVESSIVAVAVVVIIVVKVLVVDVDDNDEGEPPLAVDELVLELTKVIVVESRLACRFGTLFVASQFPMAKMIRLLPGAVTPINAASMRTVTYERLATVDALTTCIDASMRAEKE